ncbi:type VI secretion system baseplate subunit TssF [Xanthomonas euvesicatoria pv. physalidis]|uniref:type VI secretion system baseplate subunit TssF n=1 Tax=Xanthomonas euvesicatoria TaxID=456327 RepID=UPI001C46EEB8|nr:type VI secretion system baseplate subunit TssF [Xanthomonas euvesicatoria]MBV6689430.1 type VI secretion system baseplate subunit TssF [Xanthomonas euvesicatoria pv. physalidis]
MDPRLLHHYNRELQHVREMGAEFAQAYPKVAGRLGMSGIECADPYVERLLEGFAFLSARVQLELEAQQPVFAQHLMDMLYPHFLSPVPSMAVVELQPEQGEGIGPAGHLVPRGSALRSLIGHGDRTACEYRTAHAVTLWPLRLTAASYLASPAALATLGVPVESRARAGLRLVFTVNAGLRLDMLALDTLPIFITGTDGLAGSLYEQLHANALGFVVRARAADGQVLSRNFGPEHLQPQGFDDEQALLPRSERSFSGYRLLQEYFACPERFLFAAFDGLAQVLPRAACTEFEIVVWFDRAVERLDNAVDASNFRLHCTPAINLFPRRGDRIHLQPGICEHHVLADRTRPMDFEIHGVEQVEGFGDGNTPMQRFEPFYGAQPRSWHERRSAFYALRRQPRRLSTGQRRTGPRSSYVGSEVFLSLVDGDQAPYPHQLRQLGMQLWCSNRDLPLHMPVGKSSTDFVLDDGGPVAAIRCVAGPTRPRSGVTAGDTRWRLISHLQLNYLSLLEAGDDGATAVREMLTLYHDPHDAAARRQVEGVRRIASRPIVRRIPVPGPATYGRGLEITLTCDDAAFEGQGVYLLASVLRHVFARQASLNSFTETVLCTLERNEVVRWPAHLGNRPIL